jgi:predicted metal-dependent peptidase
VKSSRTQGRIQLATDRLAAEKPLHAGIQAQWRLLEDTSIDTMGIGFQRGRLTLYFNPAFVDSITLDELSAVLEHEVLHVIHGDVEHESSQGENHRAMTIAQEITVNEWVSGPLPGSPYLLEQYPTLPSNESTEDRYQRLLAILPDEEKNFDNHSRWEQLRGQLGSAVVAASIAKVWEGMTPEQRERVKLPDGARKLVEAAVKAAGDSTAIGGGMASVPWQQVLRKYVGRSLCRRPVFTRPPRRFPALVGILPGRGRQGSNPRIMAAIDTSGSMSQGILSDISAELAVMSRTHDVIVVECDTQIRAVYPFRPVTEIQGRGGTDFRPVYDPTFLQAHHPDLVVYFTDGRGKAPTEAPRIPVIWALTANGRMPCPWGRIVRITG